MCPQPPRGEGVPLLEEPWSQTEVVAPFQFRSAAPTLVRVRSWEVTSKGPPAPPLEEKPLKGLIWSASGGPARASTKGWPVGVPHPVLRSYPATAGNRVAPQVLLVLFPIVMSWKMVA